MLVHRHARLLHALAACAVLAAGPATVQAGSPLGIGPELVVDGLPVPGPAAGRQDIVAVASNGSASLVAWRDNRLGGDEDTDIFVARVGSDGVVLDPVGIAACTVSGEQLRAAVASDGTDFLVVWTDERVSGFDRNVMGARVTSTGVVLDPGGFPISTEANGQDEPVVAWNGTHYLVVWSRNELIPGDTLNEIFAARVAPDGTVVDGPPASAGFRISAAGVDAAEPTVASNGTDFLVAWTDDTTANWDVRAARVAADGTVLDPAGIDIANLAPWREFRPSVASAGSDYLVAWTLLDGDLDSSVLVARVMASSGTRFLGPVVSTQATHAAVASNGTGYLVALQDDSGGFRTMASRLSDAGDLLDPTPVIVSDTGGRFAPTPAATSDGTDYLVVWDDRRASDADVRAARVLAADGTLVDGPPDDGGILVTQSEAHGMERPAVDGLADTFLVAWEDSRDGSAGGIDLRGARLRADGTMIDASSFSIGTDALQDRAPVVSAGVDSFLVGWSATDSAWDPQQALAARVGLDGTLLDATPIQLPMARGVQDAAFDGTRWAVVVDTLPGAGLVRVEQDGSVVDAAPIHVGDNFIHESVASNGESILVTAHARRVLFATHVATDGTVLQLEQLIHDSIVSASDVASLGREYLVVFDEGTDIFGLRISAEGVVLDAPPIPICTQPSAQLLPVVVANGDAYLVAWLDRRTPGAWELWGTRVTADGTVLEPDGVPLEAAGIDDTWPALGALPCGDVLASYQRYVDEPGLLQRRIRARLVDTVSAPPREVSPWGSAAPLRLSRVGSEVELSWEKQSDCARYGVYEGDLTDVRSLSRGPLSCETAGIARGDGTRSTTVGLAPVDTFYLVTASTSLSEGSSGFDGFSSERAPAATTCGPLP